MSHQLEPERHTLSGNESALNENKTMIGTRRLTRIAGGAKSIRVKLPSTNLATAGAFLTRNDALMATCIRSQNHWMRPIAVGEALARGLD